MLHITKPMLNRDNFMAELLQTDPHLIAFSSTTNMFPCVQELVGWIRDEGCRVPIICGGVHPTLRAHHALATPGLDMICVGEGEEAIVELCRKLEEGRDYSDISNIWSKVNGEVRGNPLRPPIQNLDSLPFPDRDIFDYPNLHLESKGKAVFMATRGCPFSCTYCSNTALREVHGGPGKYLRFRSPENVTAEILEVIERYPFIRTVYFEDDILFLKKDFARRFASHYPEKISLPFTCNMHPSFCSKETVALLKKAGCSGIRIGLESGDEQIRREVLNRNYPQDVLIKAFLNCKEAGLKIRSFNMVGIPGETPRKVLETIKLNARAGIDELQCSIFQPYPGTKLYDICLEKGLFSGKIPTDYYYTPTLNLGQLNNKQIFMFRSYFSQLVKLYRIIYLLPGPISTASEKALDSILCFKYTPEPSIGLFSFLKKMLKKIKQVKIELLASHLRKKRA